MISRASCISSISSISLDEGDGDVAVLDVFLHELHELLLQRDVHGVLVAAEVPLHHLALLAVAAPNAPPGTNACSLAHQDGLGLVGKGLPQPVIEPHGQHALAASIHRILRCALGKGKARCVVCVVDGVHELCHER